MGITSRLIHTAIVKRKSRTTDSRGGNSISYTTAIASVACRLSMSSAKERYLGDKVDMEAMYKIFVLSSISVKLHDRYTISSKNYDVIGINLPSRGNHQELTVRLIQDEN